MAESHPEVIDPHDPLVERIRSICLTFPDAVELQAWGRPTFRAGKRIFVMVSSSMHRPNTIVFKPAPEELPAYQQDARFFSPPYWGHGGWIAVDIDATDTDWTEIAELIDCSYRQVALVRQLRELDSKSPLPLV